MKAAMESTEHNQEALSQPSSEEITAVASSQRTPETAPSAKDIMEWEDEDLRCCGNCLHGR